MSEQTAVPTAPTEAPDPFGGVTPSLSEFSKWRETGELPERVAPPAPEKVEPADGKEPSKEEQEKSEQERDEQGKFKPKEPLFSSDQQKAFDRAFAKREAKLRREFDERIAAIESSSKQATPPAKEATKDAAPTKPTPPKLPNLATYQGTAEEYDKEVQEYPAKFKAYLDAERESESRQAAINKKLVDSEAKVLKEHPDYKELFTDFVHDVSEGNEPGMPPHLVTAIQDADEPHVIGHYLMTNREEYRRIVSLNPTQTLREIVKIELKLATPPPAAPAPVVKPAPKAAEKYAPIEPVGARATSKAFDVNDESLTPDEWRRKREEQLKR